MSVPPALTSDPARVSVPRFGPATSLVCRECGATSDLHGGYVCLECFGPLEVAYDLPRLTHADLETGPASLWRYAPLLPVPPDVSSGPGLAAGWTPLVRADRLARELGMRRLWVKDDSGNPTHSFKDRVVAVALAAARSLGLGTLACASTGNLAHAVAAAAARAGLRSCVFIPAGLEPSKVVATAVYGGVVVEVDGTYDDVNRLCSEAAAELDWGFVNVTLRPYYAEGSKSVGFEVAEQLGWRVPEQIVVPVASGSLLTKVHKAFFELSATGLVASSACRVFGAQAAGCAPVAEAFAAGRDTVLPVRPDTIAKSLAIGSPADGPYAIDVVRRTGGAMAAVTDAEVIDGIAALARNEGIFTETAGGVTVAALRRLLTEGRLDPDAETVVVNTGDGLKTVDAVAGRAGPTVRLDGSIESFRTFARQEGLA